MIWKAGSREISLDRVLVMGILNATPDSFSDGGLYTDAQKAAQRAAQMAAQGADIIDIGAQSTRPGSRPIDASEEWQRLESVLKAVIESVDIPISVDTFYPEVAARAVGYGASIINDITGFQSQQMRKIAAETGAGCVVMHSDDITQLPDYTVAVREFFEKRIDDLVREGVSREQICLDCGVGFGKTREQEIELTAHMNRLRAGDRPLLAAVSRKRMTAYCLPYDTSPDERDHATTAAHVFAILSGANILRVHNVSAAVQCIGVAEKLGKL